jgi:hypothetical protein
VLGASDVNHLKTIPDKDNGNKQALCMSVMPTSLTCARKCLMCSWVVLVSSSLNLRKSGVLKPQGYGMVSKYHG